MLKCSETQGKKITSLSLSPNQRYHIKYSDPVLQMNGGTLGYLSYTDPAYQANTQDHLLATECVGRGTARGETPPMCARPCWGCGDPCTPSCASLEDILEPPLPRGASVHGLHAHVLHRWMHICLIGLHMAGAVCISLR